MTGRIGNMDRYSGFQEVATKGYIRGPEERNSNKGKTRSVNGLPFWAVVIIFPASFDSFRSPKDNTLQRLRFETNELNHLQQRLGLAERSKTNSGTLAFNRVPLSQRVERKLIEGLEPELLRENRKD